jgi:hypothetical protein
MNSTLTWNITCSAVNTEAARIDVANIVEESTYGTVGSRLTSDIQLELVYVYELCGFTIGTHTGYPPARRLQTSTSDVKLYQVVSKNCGGCEAEIFNATDTALTAVVNDGSLSDSVEQNSGNTISAAFRNVTSNYSPATSRPTKQPSLKPVTTKSSKSNPSPTTLKPATAKSSKSNPTPTTPIKPVTGKASKPDSKEPKDPKEPKEPKDPKDPKEPKDPKL